MVDRVSTRRPWLAALLAVIATGAGHLYLRRWRRALGWLVLSVVVTAVLVPETALMAATAGGTVGIEPMLPTFTVIGLSVLDAYLIATFEDRSHASLGSGDADPVVEGEPEAGSGTDATVAAKAADESSVDCPQCGKPLDPDLEFCHWCTTQVADPDDDQVDRDGADG